MSITFAELGVPENICRSLENKGILKPFEIQKLTITDGLEGHDICGRAPTGSGKTIAFGIPLIANSKRGEPKHPGSLILAPTRELAEQIFSELRTFAGKTKIGVVYGGVGYGNQIKSLKQGIDILVACPGRLEDLIEQGFVNLSNVNHVVLDEADRMADMGFMPSVRRLLDQTNPERQTFLFSATLDKDVAKLTREYQTNPIRHEIGEETPDIKSAHHLFWKITNTNKTEITAEAINAVWPAIIFCRTRHGSDRLAKRLNKLGIHGVTIHGGKSQNQRSRALADFTKGRVQALIATDVAARGIHVDGVASVIHYDPPEDHKAYIHRSGRTARAGQSGVVLSFVAPDQKKKARRLQHKIDIDQPIMEPDIEILKTLSPVNNSDKKFQAPYKERSETKNSNSKNSSHKKNGSQKKQGSGKRRSNNSSNKHRGGNKHKNSNKNRNRNKHRPSGSNNQSSQSKNKNHTSSSKKNSQSKNSKGSNRSSNKNRNNKNHQNRKQNQKAYASR
ncbi:MAG: DEAD/DEAH box helicase [Acidimicrobiales bacterium]|jgi:superfamily II DNA/RNA helicase|nr:DEAD/DEAH box helicase [Acidimicrobiales bacterium]|tara:strand:+ start:28536 stop:30050 length:1515 start_codon:yes stop_codon:yes gene_type:complete